MTVSVPLPSLFHVNRTLAFLRTSSLRTPYHFGEGHRVRRLVRLRGRPVVVEFMFPHRGTRLRVAVVPGRAGRDSRAEERREFDPLLRTLATAVWSLDDDLGACYRTLRRDPLMVPLVKRCAGLRMIRTPSLYEVLLIAVVGQQVSVAAAESVRRRLMTALGDRVVRDGVTFTAYPPPRRLLATPPRILRTLGLSRQKTQYVLEIAEQTAGGSLEPGAFERLSDGDAIARLVEIPGVGRWTAEIALMRGLGRPDVFPAADLGLQVAVQRLMKRADRPMEDELRTMAERWAGWRSYGALYLWRSLGIAA